MELSEVLKKKCQHTFYVVLNIKGFHEFTSELNNKCHT